MFKGFKFNLGSLLVAFLPAIGSGLGNWANSQINQSQQHHGAVTLGYVAALGVTGVLGGLLHGAATAQDPKEAPGVSVGKSG